MQNGKTIKNENSYLSQKIIFYLLYLFLTQYTMSKIIKFRRHGDVNMFPITEEEFNSSKGMLIKHKGKYVLAEGEATNSLHEISVKNPDNMILKQCDNERLMIAIKNEEATITHTHDHETITAPKHSFFVQVPERELDHFANSVERKVID